MFKFSEVVTNLYLRCTLAGLSVDESSEIFNLNINCFEELFEWLPISDLFTLRQTCKHMKHVVDYFIRTNYPAIQIGYKKIALFASDLKEFNHLDLITLKAIREIFFWTEELTLDEIDSVKCILPQIERLFIGWPTEGEFYRAFLQHCTHLKFLSMSKKYSPDVENEWLLESYPMLQQFVVNDFDVDGPEYGWQVPELQIFFQQNPNVRTFSTTFHFLRENQQYLMGANVKLDRLEIQGHGYNLESTCDLLNTLYEQGFYRQLHLYLMVFTVHDLSQTGELRGLEKLYLANRCLDDKDEIVLPVLDSLKEVGFNYGNNTDKLKSVAMNLTNVERVYFEKASLNDLLHFVRHSRKVERIHVTTLENGNSLDLAAINEYRAAVTGATKVIIHVSEAIFLKTKYSTPTKLDLVELKRTEAYNWEHLTF